MKYALITPARNEGGFLEVTINAVARQALLPVRWVIVNDGSTDSTEAIAAEYAAKYPWIMLISRSRADRRSFAGKVAAFNAGMEQLHDVQFDVVGSLDADLSFGPTYFEFLLQQFASDPTLGVAGTPFEEEGRTYDYRFSSLDHVSGACQLFRLECFREIGGYVPLKDGGIDVVAVLTARMKGWRTRTFTEQVCVHHRPMGSALHGRFVANYKLGQRAYRLGFHPIWQLCRSAYQMTRPPYVTAGVALLAGYCDAMMRRTDRLIGQDLIAFQGDDQMRRLRAFVGRRLGWRQEHRTERSSQ